VVKKIDDIDNPNHKNYDWLIVVRHSRAEVTQFKSDKQREDFTEIKLTTNKGN